MATASSSSAVSSVRAAHLARIEGFVRRHLDLPDLGPESVAAGLPVGAPVGEARLTLEGEVLAAAPLVVAEAVAKQDYAFGLERIVQQWVMNPYQTIAE